MTLGLHRARSVVFCLYVASLATTMAGMEIFSSCLVLLTLVSLLSSREGRASFRNLASLPFAKPLLLFMAVMALGILAGSATSAQKLHDLGRLRFFFLYFVITLYLTILEPQSSFRLFLRTLVVITVLVAVYGVVQHFVAIDLFRPEGKKVLLYAIQDQKIGPLVVGTFNHHLTFSNIYLFYACLFVALGLVTQKFVAGIPSRALLVLGGWLFLLCFWTQSRAAWAAIPIVLGVIASMKSLRSAVIVLLFVAVGMVGFYFTDSGFRERFERTLFKKDDLYNIGPRTRLWRAQWEFFKQSPLIGVGHDNNERHAKSVVDKLYPENPDNFYGHAHSTPLQILATTGILGSLAFYWLWAQVFGRLLQLLKAREETEKWLAVGLLAGFIGFFIQGLTQWNFGDAEVLHNVIFLLALTASRRI